MKESRACTGMLSYENDAFEFSKTAKTINSTCITCTIVPGLVELFFFSPNQSAIEQKHEWKSSCQSILYIFQNIEIWILVTFH